MRMRMIMEISKFTKKYKIQQSMSRVGCPYDNASIERYYNPLKSEHIYHFSYSTKETLDSGVITLTTPPPFLSLDNISSPL